MKYSSFTCNSLGQQPLLAAPNETLEKHIKDVTNELVSRFLKKKACTLMRLLRSHSLTSGPATVTHTNVSFSDARNVFLYSAIFHDLGKAYDWFQNRIIEAAKKNPQNFSVPRHEIFSAFAAMQILTENAFTNSFQFLRDCVLLSIVWSHSAIRGMVLPEIMYTTSDYIKVKSVYLSKRGKLEIMAILNSILAKYECEDGIDLLKLPTEISINEVEKMLKMLDKSLNSNLLLYYATLPVLSTLQIVDSLVAHKNRGGKPQVHVVDLPDPSVINKVRVTLWSIEQ